MDASIDSNNSYDIHGLDGKIVQCYKAKVYGPDFSEVADLSNEDVSRLWDIALDTEMLKEIQIFVEKLNKSDVLPKPPSCYDKWVSAYKKMVMHSVYRKWKEYSWFIILLDDETKTLSFVERINPTSWTKRNGFIEGTKEHFEPLEKFQFIRDGYYCVDKLSKDDDIIFNRIAPLKSTFK